MKPVRSGRIHDLSGPGPQSLLCDLWRRPEGLAAIGAVAAPREALRQGRQENLGLVLEGPGRIEHEEPAAVQPRRVPRIVYEEFQAKAGARAFPVEPCGERIDGPRILD